MKLWIKRQIMRRATDLERRDRARAKASQARRRSGARRVVSYFHRFGDPASALMAPLMLALQQRFEINVEVWLTGPPEAAVAPEPVSLEVFARADAARLAQVFGLAFTNPGAPPDRARIAEADNLGAAALGSDDALARIASLDAALWADEAFEPGESGEAARALKAGSARRDGLGHFQSGTAYFEGEWYWGADRLHYLETRLDEDGARCAGEGFLAPPLLESQAQGDVRGAVIEVYPSLRSPYTWLAMARVFALAERWNARVVLRPVLPMVMRSLPVPQRKGLYFLKDCAREAQRLGLEFGNISDPVGAPTARGLAVLMPAIEADKGEAFVLSFLKGAWSEGVDAGTDRGLREMAERAGVAWVDVKAGLADSGWRAEVEANRKHLTERGLWGVPSFTIGDIAVWGQDRLWVVEAELKRLAERKS